MDKVDYMQQYKQIKQKIEKKRFLRKPNVAEAAEEFQVISKNLARQDCPSYSAFFQLAKARCEHTLSNSVGEIEALTEAARQFFHAELQYKTRNSPTYDENLNAAINCYAHAVRVHIENRQTPHAAALCIELGDNLEQLGKVEEAVNHYLRASELQALNPIDRLQALRKVADCKLKIQDYDGALKTLVDINKTCLEYGCATSGLERQKKKPVGFYYDLCHDAEIEQVLLLLIIRPVPSRMNPEHSALLEKYTWDIDLPDLNSGLSEPDLDTYLELEDFLLLQSIVMASQSNDFDSLSKLLTDVFHRWKPIHTELMFEICERKNGDGYGGSLFRRL